MWSEFPSGERDGSPARSRPAAAVLALLLAISPLLVIHSRLARPYAITLLLGWIAHAAFQRYHASTRGRTAAGLGYGTAATLAVWLHPIAAPFVLAPWLWALAQLRRVAPAERRAQMRRLARLALPTGVAIAVLILPPLFARPQSLASKSGIDLPGLEALAGVWYAWLGTGSTAVVLICVALATYGAPAVWRTLPEARTGVLGIALTLAAVILARPAWSQLSLTLARYLLPFLPLLLLGVAAGAVRAAGRLARPPTPVRRGLAAAMTVLPLGALAAQSPLVPMLHHPNAEAVHMMFYFEFRPEKNPYFARFERIPLSPFWASLAARPAGSVRVAAAPLHFESFNWDAPRWEQVSRQSVIPGYLTGLCVDRRWGEVPQGCAFRFRNAAHLADADALARRKIDCVVWQKPYVQTDGGGNVTIGGDTAHCEAVLREKFGPPAFEDSALVAFRLSRPEGSSPRAEQ